MIKAGVTGSNLVLRDVMLCAKAMNTTRSSAVPRISSVP